MHPLPERQNMNTSDQRTVNVEKSAAPDVERAGLVKRSTRCLARANHAMRTIIMALSLAAGPALALDVPSGQKVDLQEVLVDQIGDETWVRFRFVTPQISRDGGDVDYDASTLDMTHLCEALALPYAAEYELGGDVIVISFADRETEFGVADPDATQFFEAFRAVDNTCIWEGL
ncbi:MAG: DUF6497 family protein [Sulfitobacter sp.]